MLHIIEENKPLGFIIVVPADLVLLSFMSCDLYLFICYYLTHLWEKKEKKNDFISNFISERMWSLLSGAIYVSNFFSQ